MSAEVSDRFLQLVRRIKAECDENTDARHRDGFDNSLIEMPTAGTQSDAKTPAV